MLKINLEHYQKIKTKNSDPVLVGVYIYGITTLWINLTISSGVEIVYFLWTSNSSPGYIYISSYAKMCTATFFE